MKRQLSKVSSMTDRRIDNTLLARRAVKRALSRIRLLCAKFHRDVDRKNGVVRMEDRLQSNLDEQWNLTNENLENELRELAMRTGHRLRRVDDFVRETR